MKTLNIRSARELRFAALFAFAAFALSCGSSILSGPEETAVTVSITAGPTVESALDSLTISFTTNVAATSRLEYGTASGSYGTFVSESAAGTDHDLVIDGLDQGTTYYYRIVSALADSRTFTSAEFSAATTMEEGITAAQLQRGIWLVGGLSGSAVSNTVAAVDLYDPLSNTWYPAVTSVPEPVSFAGYAAYDGKLYVIGGFDGTGTVRDIVQIYDTETETWSNGTAMTAARANVHAAVCNGKIYIIGGSVGPLAATAWNANNTTYEYNPGGDAWTSMTAPGTTWTERFAYTYNNTVYNFGGRTAAATLAVVGSHTGFVPSMNLYMSGTAGVALPAVRAGASGAPYVPEGNDAFVILIGGASALTASASCFVNNGAPTMTANNTAYCLPAPFSAPSVWRTGTTAYPQSIAFGAAAVSTTVTPARVYQFGGTTALGASASGQAAAYWSAVPDSTAAWTTAWTSVTMPRGRWGHGAVTMQQ